MSEMDIDKIYAVINERLPDSKRAVSSVVGIKMKNGSFIGDQSEVRKFFPHEGKVFTPKAFEGDNDTQLKIGDLVEIPVMQLHPAEVGRPLRVDHRMLIKKPVSTLVEVPLECLDDGYFKLDLLKSFLDSIVPNLLIIGDLYVSISDHFYGPFRYNLDKLEAKTGKEVGKFLYVEEALMDYGRIAFLLNRPNNELCKIDCMNTQQVLEWLKDIIKAHSEFSTDINKIKNIVKKHFSEEIPLNEIDRLRMERAIRILETLELSAEEISRLRSDPKWYQVFQAAYDRNREVFREAHLEELKDDFAQKNAKYLNTLVQLEAKIKSLENEKERSEAALAKIVFSLESLKGDLLQLTEHRETLVSAMKIQAGISTNSSESFYSKKISSYEIQQFIGEENGFFESVDDFLEDIKSKLSLKGHDLKLIADSIPILLKNKFILASSTHLPLSIICHLGNAKVCIDQASLDWIKFERWLECGLDEFFTSALSDDALPHFYILQDFNIASFECYGRPIMDLADRIRRNVPGKLDAWPKNLSVILISAHPSLGDLALPVNKNTFANWGVLPYQPEFRKYVEFSAKKRLSVDILTNVTESLSQTIDDYCN